jgi:hypothetical protein
VQVGISKIIEEHGLKLHIHESMERGQFPNSSIDYDKIMALLEIKKL